MCDRICHPRDSYSGEWGITGVLVRYEWGISAVLVGLVEGSWPRCAVHPSLPPLPQQGVIVSGGEEYLIEPLAPATNHSRVERAEGHPHVIYKRSSLRHQYMNQSCGVIGRLTRPATFFTDSSRNHGPQIGRAS